MMRIIVCQAYPVLISRLDSGITRIFKWLEAKAKSSSKRDRKTVLFKQNAAKSSSKRDRKTVLFKQNETWRTTVSKTR